MAISRASDEEKGLLTLPRVAFGTFRDEVINCWTLTLERFCSPRPYGTKVLTEILNKKEKERP